MIKTGHFYHTILLLYHPLIDPWHHPLCNIHCSHNLCKQESVSLPYSGVRPLWWQDLQSINLPGGVGRLKVLTPNWVWVIKANYHNEYSTFTTQHYNGQFVYNNLIFAGDWSGVPGAPCASNKYGILCRDVCSGPGHDTAGLCHAVYRQVVLWWRGQLGANVHRVIPSCVVCRIRDSRWWSGWSHGPTDSVWVLRYQFPTPRYKFSVRHSPTYCVHLHLDDVVVGFVSLLVQPTSGQTYCCTSVCTCN